MLLAVESSATLCDTMGQNKTVTKQNVAPVCGWPGLNVPTLNALVTDLVAANLQNNFFYYVKYLFSLLHFHLQRY